MPKTFMITIYDQPREVEITLSESELALCRRLLIDPATYAKHLFLEREADITEAVHFEKLT